MKNAKSRKPEECADFWELRLYVAGQTPKSLATALNLKKICEQYLLDKYRIEIINVLKNPILAKEDQIIAIPTLLRKHHEPVRRIIGDLSNTERVLAGLEIRPVPKARRRKTS
jgi:circadian clock protein KaiB